MNTAPLLCLGTPLGHWPSIAHALQSPHDAPDQALLDTWIAAKLGVSLPVAGTASEYEASLHLLSNRTPHRPFIDSGAPFPEFRSGSRVLCAPLACWLADAWMERLPDAQILAFYESPAHLLARCLEWTPSATPDSLLTVWEAATAKLLATLRRSRSRVFLVSAEECLAAPQAFQRWLQETLGLSWEGAFLPPPPPVDPALLSLSETLCAATTSLLPLMQECEASLRPLGSADAPLPSSRSAALARDGLLHALSLKRDLAHAQTELASTRESATQKLQEASKLAESHLQSLRAELASTQSKLAGVAGELQSAKHHSSALETELAAARENTTQKLQEASGIHEMLLLEIHNAHKESEGFFEQLTQAQEAATLAESHLENLRAELASTQAHAAALAGELESAKHRSSALESEVAAARENTTQKLQEASGIHEMLLLEIHNAHKESEDFFERWKKAETLHSQLALKAGRLQRGPVHDYSEHRHFQFSLHDVELFGRSWPRLDFRLLLHRGNAGIALFLPPHAPTPPLHTWEPAGTENGVPYVLFVPSDSKAKHALVATTTHDFLLLKDAVALLAADFRFQGAPSHSKTDWPLAASRLLEELLDLPERLHYDAVHTRLEKHPQGGLSLHFSVVQAFFRATLHPALDFTWTPSSKAGGTLTLHRTEGNPPPLCHWPLAPEGSLATQWSLDLGNAPSLKAKRKLWSRFSSNEKAFLGALISEIPNFVFHLHHQHPNEPLDRESLNRQARSMRAEVAQLGRRPTAVARLRMALSQ
jgi:hypothetical protein